MSKKISAIVAGVSLIFLGAGLMGYNMNKQYLIGGVETDEIYEAGIYKVGLNINEEYIDLSHPDKPINDDMFHDKIVVGVIKDKTNKKDLIAFVDKKKIFFTLMTCAHEINFI